MVIRDWLRVSPLVAGVGPFQRWGTKWGRIRGTGDPGRSAAGDSAVSQIYGFVLTPIIQHNHIRTTEREADMYGLECAAGAARRLRAGRHIHLGEYRKMKPGPMEEWMFYDHPSGYSRIYSAMRWKAENLNLFPAQTEGDHLANP